jgi:hypothetical protein
MLTTLLGFLAMLPPELLQPPPTVVEAALSRISKSREYTMRISIPGGGEHVMKFKAQDDGEGTTWGGWRIVPNLIPKAIPDDGRGKGQVTLTLEFPGQKDSIVLKSRGPAEDIYLLRTCVPEKDSAKLIEKMTPDSKLVVAWPEKEPELAVEPLKKVPDELAAAVKLGNDAYEARRPELIRRFSSSFLFYPPTAAKDWTVRVGKDRLWLDTGCHDRMYAAHFRVELRKTDKGEWEIARILAKEYFKGD